MEVNDNLSAIKEEKGMAKHVKVTFWDVRKVVKSETIMLSKIQFASEKDRRLANIVKSDDSPVNMLALDQIVNNKNYIIFNVEPVKEEEKAKK